MEKQRQGVIAAGNWIVDNVKVIDCFPHQDGLANILQVSQSNGGSAYNILKNLAKMGAPFPLAGIGLVGKDAFGQQILADCEQLGIDTLNLKVIQQAATSYTDVMSVAGTGRRTFFHHRGANALLQPADISLEGRGEKIFHLGYMLLLDALDAFYPDGSTGAAKVLENAKNLGFYTSVDVVSEASDRFSSIIPPALPYVDYLFLNEYEAGKITGMTLEENGEVNPDKAIMAAKSLLEMGVQSWVILHFAKGAVAVNKLGEYFKQGKVQVPPDAIAGATGAGDAFASGVLWGIHQAWPMPEILANGVATAAACLLAPDCSSSLMPREKNMALAKQWGFAEL